jgi:hypothetical protein
LNDAETLKQLKLIPNFIDFIVRLSNIDLSNICLDLNSKYEPILIYSIVLLTVLNVPVLLDTNNDIAKYLILLSRSLNILNEKNVAELYIDLIDHIQKMINFNIRLGTLMVNKCLSLFLTNIKGTYFEMRLCNDRTMIQYLHSLFANNVGFSLDYAIVVF